MFDYCNSLVSDLSKDVKIDCSRLRIYSLVHCVQHYTKSSITLNFERKLLAIPRYESNINVLIKLPFAHHLVVTLFGDKFLILKTKCNPPHFLRSADRRKLTSGSGDH